VFTKFTYEEDHFVQQRHVLRHQKAQSLVVTRLQILGGYLRLSGINRHFHFPQAKTILAIAIRRTSANLRHDP
jgi:hypothetical protein